MHLFRGLYFTSYAQPREAVWLIGVIILLLMILTRFIGYVLPWGLNLAQNDIIDIKQWLSEPGALAPRRPVPRMSLHFLMKTLGVRFPDEPGAKAPWVYKWEFSLAFLITIFNNNIED
jgi:hypothetical protein